MREGVSQRCVVATLEDLELANRLATATLAPQVEALLPQTRQLLAWLQSHVEQRSEREQIPRQEVRFTQREIREALWLERSYAASPVDTAGGTGIRRGLTDFPRSPAPLSTALRHSVWSRRALAIGADRRGAGAARGSSAFPLSRSVGGPCHTHILTAPF